MIEDLEITFGKSVLIEKCPNDVISLGINRLCMDGVPRTKIHCLVSGGRLITIRNLKGVGMFGKDYCAFRIITIKKTHKDITVEEISKNHNETQNFVDEVIESNVHRKNYKLNNYGLELIDSSVIICHKYAFTYLIRKTFNEIVNEFNSKYNKSEFQSEHIGYKTFGFEKSISFTRNGAPPCVRADLYNNGQVLYGGNKKEQVSFAYTKTIKTLKEQTNFWLKEKKITKFDYNNSLTLSIV